MSMTQEDLKKKLEEDAKREQKRSKDYEPPKDPSGVTGSTKQVDGKPVNEIGYKIASPNGDELSGSVQQDNKNGTITAKGKISDGQNTVEASLTEKKGDNSVAVSYTKQTGASETNKVTVTHDGATDTTSVKVEHQKDKDKQAVEVKVNKNGANLFANVTEDMGDKGSLEVNGSTNLKDSFSIGGKYKNAGVGGSFTTESTPNGWTNTYGASVETGRIKGEVTVKDAPNKSPEVTFKGTVGVGPEPSKAEPTFWDKPELKQTPEEYGKFRKAVDQLSPADKKLYETSLAAVEKAIDSGQPGMAAYKGRETELAMNVALQAKTLGMTEVADLRTHPGPNGQQIVRLGEKPLDDPSLDTRNGPSSKGISLNALDKPPMDALGDLRTTVPEKGSTTQGSPTQQTNEIPKEVPVQESSQLKR